MNGKIAELEDRVEWLEWRLSLTLRQKIALWWKRNNISDFLILLSAIVTWWVVIPYLVWTYIPLK